MLKVWHLSNSDMENLFQEADTSMGCVAVLFLLLLLCTRATS